MISIFIICNWKEILIEVFLSTIYYPLYIEVKMYVNTLIYTYQKLYIGEYYPTLSKVIASLNSIFSQKCAAYFLNCNLFNDNLSYNFNRFKLKWPGKTVLYFHLSNCIKYICLSNNFINQNVSSILNELYFNINKGWGRKNANSQICAWSYFGYRASKL